MPAAYRIIDDHGELVGLGDDDHSQYHNDARADTWLGTKDTDDLAEGSVNRYYAHTLARAAVSTTVVGLSYDAASGVLSLASGYSIPTDAAQNHWNDAYGWGNHASAGYAANSALTAHATDGTVHYIQAAITKVNSSLTTGLLKVANGTGTLTTAVAGTDYETPQGSSTTAKFWRGDKKWSDTIVGPLVVTTTLQVGNSSSAGQITVQSGTGTSAFLNYSRLFSLVTTSGLVKCSGAGAFSAAVAGVDYMAPGGSFDHGGLTGLTDDDHTQYIKVGGRSTPQVITGGTQAGQNLTLVSTGNATKGRIVASDIIQVGYDSGLYFNSGTLDLAAITRPNLDARFPLVLDPDTTVAEGGSTNEYVYAMHLFRTPKIVGSFTAAADLVIESTESATKGSITTTSDVRVRAANRGLYLGTSDNAAITHDGTNLVINSKNSGTGNIKINGNVGSGADPVNNVKFYVNNISTDTAGYSYGFYATITAQPAVDCGVSARGAACTVSTSGNANITGTLYGAYFVGQHAGGGTINGVVGAQFSIQNVGVGAIAFSQGLSLSCVLTDLGTIGSHTDIYIGDVSPGSGTVTTQYGIYIANKDGATNNYAICVRGGTVVFNEDGTAASDFRVEGDTNQNLLFVDASADTVCIGTGTAVANTVLTVNGGASFTGNTGFNGVAPAARPAAYTQTYSTASRVCANLTSSSLTDNTGGTADATLAAVEASYTQATIRNNFADLAAQINAIRADLIEVKKNLNSVIDDGQLYGLLQ